MKKQIKNNDGFGIIEIIVIIAVVGLLGVIGWVLYSNSHGAKSTYTPSPSSSTASPPVSTSNPQASSLAPFVNVIQDDGSVTQETPHQAAKTADQIGVLNALHDTCKGDSSYVTISHTAFEGNSNFKQDGNYAEINASTCNEAAKMRDDIQGSGSANYLHKNDSGVWIFDLATQGEPSCGKVDGLGYPASLMSSCYDGSTSRAPR